MVSIRDEITIEIGNLIGQSANYSSKEWSYAGYSVRISDSSSISWEVFLFNNRNRLIMKDEKFEDKLEDNFFRLREITRVDGDDYWKTCLAVVRNETKEFRMLFEFDDASRWRIRPENARQSYEILVGEIFPEALE